MESMKVRDEQLIASSSLRYGLGPHRSRLNIQSGIEDGDERDGAWCAGAYDTSQWLQLDALHLTLFTGLVTQGRSSIWTLNWVTSFRVFFSNDTVGWFPYRTGDYDVYFPGNRDAETPVLTTFPVAVAARYLRINPQNWHHNGSVCLRMEVLGCLLEDPYDVRAIDLVSYDELDFTHHDYKGMRKLMRAVNDKCPDITRIYSIGQSVQHRKLYAMEVSDNPGVHEPGEPEFRYVGGMHGNEALGRELLLNLMEFLCHEYRRGSRRVHYLVNNTRLHLLPSMNPDGHERAFLKVRGPSSRREGLPQGERAFLKARGPSS
ncbi:putative carboxypeptidase X1, partial [Lampetra fluviatilis]